MLGNHFDWLLRCPNFGLTIHCFVMMSPLFLPYSWRQAANDDLSVLSTFAVGTIHRRSVERVTRKNKSDDLQFIRINTNCRTEQIIKTIECHEEMSFFFVFNPCWEPAREIH